MHKHTVKEYHIYDQVYKINITLVIGCKSAAVTLLKQKHNLDLEEELEEFVKGYTMMHEENIYVWLGEFNTSADFFSNFVHEMFHAATYTLDSRGVKFSVHNDEPYAYYLAFLVRMFLEQIKGK